MLLGARVVFHWVVPQNVFGLYKLFQRLLDEGVYDKERGEKRKLKAKTLTLECYAIRDKWLHTLSIGA